MGFDLLKSFKILTKFAFPAVSKDLGELAISDILLSVEEPIWNLVLTWILHNCDDSLNLQWEISGVKENVYNLAILSNTDKVTHCFDKTLKQNQIDCLPPHRTTPQLSW